MMGLVRRLATALCVTALCGMTGCAGFWVYPGTASSTGTAGSDYVYVANAGAETISGFVVGTGTLTAISGTPTLSYAPTAMVVNTANSILYVASNSAIYAYSIGTGGVLSGGTVEITGVDVVSMNVSPDGQWLFALDENASTLYEYTITSSGLSVNTSGLLAPESLAQTVASSQAVKVAPDGKNVFVARGLEGDVVFPLTTSTGALGTGVVLNPISTATSDNALTVDPTSTYLYIARSGTNSGLAVYSITYSNGTPGLTQVGSTYSTGSVPYSVVMNAGGTDVYVANRSDGTISGYSVASGGALTSLGSAYSSGSGVDALAMDKSGSYLLAAALNGSSDLTMYSFSSGALVSQTTAVTGNSPIAIATTHP